MSSHSAAGAASGLVHHDEVAAIVAAARSRVRLVVLVRTASVAVPASVAAGAGLALSGVAPDWLPVVLGAGAFAGAALWAVRHTPALPAVAGRLDAALGLRDRVAAAVQLRGDETPIAALVRRDAGARLAGVRLGTVFPMTAARPSAALVALAAGLSAWLAWTGSGLTAPQRSAAPGLRSAGASGSNAGGRQGPATGTRSAAEETARAAADPSTDVRREPNQALATGVADAAPRPAGGAPPATDVSAARGRPPLPAPARAGLAEAAAPATTAGGGARSGTPGSSAHAAPSLEARGAGGVSRGGALAEAESRAPAPILTSDGYAAARANAEAALARDVIPPAYRDDVRAYFRTLAQRGSR